MSELVWSVKRSLLGDDANVSVGEFQSDGAALQRDGFRFPADPAGRGRYLGSIIIGGKAGMLSVAVRNPGLDDGEHVWIEADDGSRVRFASIERWIQRDGELRAEGTVLSSEGAAYLADALPAGTPLDDPILVG